MTCECFTKPWSAGNDREDERVCADDCKCRCHEVEKDFWEYFGYFTKETTKSCNLTLKLFNLEQVLRCDSGGPVKCHCTEPDFYTVKIDDRERKICKKCCGPEKY